MSGSQFSRLIWDLDKDAREARILDELRKGNIPNYLRNMQPVWLTATSPSGEELTAKIWVMPDYLSIGSDQDFLRVPINPLTAQVIADQFALTLPTPKIVDAIYAQSKLKLYPITMRPGKSMTSTSYLSQHNGKIERQRSGRPNNVIIAGHKKDIVLSNELINRPSRVAIYGWHRGLGNPIQPLSLVHDNRYADYSHGARLISKVIIVNGKTMTIDEVARNPELAPLLSNEGVLRVTRIPFAPRTVQRPLN